MKIGRSALLLMSIGFTGTLILFRIAYTREFYFLFLVWNLFLAWIPYLFSLVPGRSANILIQAASIAGWLLFFPNAPYIITDLFHLQESTRIPFWFDLIVLFSAAWNGLLLGLFSIHHVELFLLSKFRPLTANVILAGCIFMGGFGVYAGRYLRWNSWHILTHPRNIISDALPRLIYPQYHLSAWGMTIVLGSFLLIIYLTVRHSRFS